MKNSDYCNDNRFNEEMKIWSSSYVFVGLLSDLNHNNKYITFKTSFANIVIQNFKGEIKAFENICLHRFSTIHSEPKGQRPLVCPYHSWGYDGDGCTRMSSNKLKSYPVEVVGEFVFIQLNKSNVTSLEDYLGNFYHELLKISGAIDPTKVAPDHSIQHRANWKLLVENVLECYHCQSVHKESLGVLGLGKGEPYNYKSYGPHNSIEYPLNVDSKVVNSKRLGFMERRMLKHNSYLHFYIFPNLFISSSGGMFFYVGRLDPINPKLTDLKMNFISPRTIDNHEVKLKGYLDVNRNNTIQVVEEDRKVVEDLQDNMAIIPDRTQQFGSLEERIIDFHSFLNLNT